jgi:hypothetical protein
LLGVGKVAASSRPPEGLGLDWSEHGRMLDRIGDCWSQSIALLHRILLGCDQITTDSENRLA